METEYWRRLAMQTMRKKEAATAAARKWRGVAAELQDQVDYMTEAVCYRFRGRRDGMLYERDVVKVHRDDLEEVISLRPYLADWHQYRDKYLVMMLSPSDATTPLPVDSDREPHVAE